jgi:hypothetical protein
MLVDVGGEREQSMSTTRTPASSHGDAHKTIARIALILAVSFFAGLAHIGVPIADDRPTRELPLGGTVARREDQPVRPKSVATEGPRNIADPASEALKLTYTLHESVTGAPADIQSRISEAMRKAAETYNATAAFDKQVSVRYNAEVPTANANFHGVLTFGKQIGYRTALHEIAHTLGVGTHPRWQSFAKDGRWTGRHANHQLREFDGPDAVLNVDRQHFWPYGLNYENEGSPDNFRRHVLMVAAFAKDLAEAHVTEEP